MARGGGKGALYFRVLADALGALRASGLSLGLVTNKADAVRRAVAGIA